MACDSTIVYDIKSGKTDIADVCIARYPFSFSVMPCKTKTADFCSTVTTLCEMLNEEVNLPQINAVKGSKRKLYAHSED